MSLNVRKLKVFYGSLFSLDCAGYLPRPSLRINGPVSGKNIFKAGDLSMCSSVTRDVVFCFSVTFPLHLIC